MSTKNVTFRIDEKLKKEGEQLFSELGMNMTTALTTFIKQAVREKRIPFEITLDIPNRETLKAFIEAEELLNNPNSKRFKSTNDLFEDLDN